MSIKAKAPPPASILRNVGTAPIVYFDGVPVFGANAAIIEIELSMRVMLPKSDGGVIVETMCTGHLRCPPAAAALLADSIQRALKMLEPQQDEAKAEQKPAQQLHS